MNATVRLLLILISALVAAPAFAEGAPPEPNFLVQMAPLIIIFVIFYFMLIRPQSKRAKEHKSMVEALQKGDELVTNGGLLGKVVKAGENYLDVEIAEGVVVKVQRGQVATLMPKGTIKSA
ncbi:MAG: preprotein translocase subunit YajC [Gammaproteobacteria bacterium]|nr:preprotein translocase subunit YajC [Gammaproteobacteria bacterium]MCP5136839.1 preprotein translocase subunit YajC [Gammaproteobacteria bacterium]